MPAKKGRGHQAPLRMDMGTSKDIQVWACKTKSCDAFGMWTSKAVCPYCGGKNAKA